MNLIERRRQMMMSKSKPYDAEIEYLQGDGSAYLNLEIPVRVGQVGYMYDRVSGQLFGNQGTGNFILGEDKN